MCLGLPSSPPIITAVSTLSNGSFNVNWTMSDPIYNCMVMWTNLNTSEMNSTTVPENTNSYTVTGLSDNDNYNVSVAAVNMCGNMTSDPVTVNSEFALTYVHVCMHILILILIKFIFYILLVLRMHVAYIMSPNKLKIKLLAIYKITSLSFLPHTYRIAGYFRGGKFSRISRIGLNSRIFSP